MRIAKIYLLGQDPRFRYFSYRVPLDKSYDKGELVIVPFREKLVAGIIAELTNGNLNGLLPIVGRLRLTTSPVVHIGKMILALSRLYLCSPAEIFDLVTFGQAQRRINLFFFTVRNGKRH